MSMNFSNINSGGYVPPGFGSGHPPNAPPADGSMYQPTAGYPPTTPQYGFRQPSQAVGFSGGHNYTPVPQMPPYNGPQTQPLDVNQQVNQYHPQQFVGQQNYVGGPPIMNQPGIGPGTGDTMAVPVGIPNCPRGLEYLTTIDQLLVKQEKELLEIFTGYETNNKYTIKNSLGQKVFYAVEDTDCCTRNLCGSARPFNMKLLDNYKTEIMNLERPLACSSCCFPCCLQSLEVSSPPGCVIGSIEQEWSLLSPRFTIKNHLGDSVLRIDGPLCTFTMCGNVEFQVLSLTGEQIGKISKQWSGLAREIFTDADFFGLTFPMDLDVRMKAVLLGATFLIDAMFFENNQR